MENLEFFDNLPEIEGNETEPIVEINRPEDPAPEVNIPDENQEEETVEQEVEAVGYYNTLVDKGFIEKSDDFKGTFDSLGEAIEKSALSIAAKSEEVMSSVAEAIYTNAPDTLKKVLEFSFLKPDATKQELKDFVDAFVSEIPVVQEVKTNEDARKYLETTYSKTMNRVAVRAALDALEDESETALVEEANKQIGFHNADVKAKNSDKAEAILNETKRAKKEREEADLAFANSIYDEIKATDWQDKRKKTLTGFVSSGKANEVIKAASQKPKAFLQLADLATYYDPVKGEFDISAYVKQASTKAVEEMKNNAIKDNFKSTGGKGTTKTPQSDELKLEMII